MNDSYEWAYLVASDPINSGREISKENTGWALSRGVYVVRYNEPDATDKSKRIVKL